MQICILTMPTVDKHIIKTQTTQNSSANTISSTQQKIIIYEHSRANHRVFRFSSKRYSFQFWKSIICSQVLYKHGLDASSAYQCGFSLALPIQHQTTCHYRDGTLRYYLELRKCNHRPDSRPTTNERLIKCSTNQTPSADIPSRR